MARMSASIPMCRPILSGPLLLNRPEKPHLSCTSAALAHQRSQKRSPSLGVASLEAATAGRELPTVILVPQGCWSCKSAE